MYQMGKVVHLNTYTSDHICKNMPARFSPGFGRSPNPGLHVTGDSKPRGAPSRLAQVNSPVHRLSAGGLLGTSCQNQGGGEGVLYICLHLVRLGHLSAK